MDQGEFLIGYQFMHMRMKGHQDGTSKISKKDFWNGTSYMVRPKWMTMDMHMFHFMYSPIQDLTAMLMVPLLNLEMKHETRMGSTFKTQNDGFGDLEFMVHWAAYESDLIRVIPNAAISFPTGKLANQDVTPMGKVRLPYPMRLGSGTWDPSIGLTVVSETANWNLGGDIKGTFRPEKNKYHYRLGHEMDLQLWAMRRINDWFALSVRGELNVWGNIKGHDDKLNPAIVPTADPKRRGGERIDLLGGVTVLFPSGFFQGNRLVLEVGHAVYQRLDGPQLRSRFQVKLDWIYRF